LPAELGKSHDDGSNHAEEEAFEDKAKRYRGNVRETFERTTQAVRGTGHALKQRKKLMGMLSKFLATLQELSRERRILLTTYLR
jgi:hypothetical protein